MDELKQIREQLNNDGFGTGFLRIEIHERIQSLPCNNQSSLHIIPSSVQLRTILLVVSCTTKDQPISVHDD